MNLYLFRESRKNSLSVSQNHFQFTLLSENTINLLCFSRNHYDITMNSLLLFRDPMNSLFILPNLLRIHYHCQEFVIKSLYLSHIKNEFTIFNSNSFWIHYLCRVFTINYLWLSPVHFKFASFNANLFWFYNIDCLFKQKSL